MDTSIKDQSRLATVSKFECPNCGSSLSVSNPRAQYVACHYCGSVLDANSKEHKILKQLSKPSRHKPFSFIRLGQIATFNNRQYQVIARTRWRMDYKEYWSEEGETGYSNEVWIYDEWLLMDVRMTYFYLVEDREGYWISEEIIPETPSLLTNDLRMSFYKGQRREIVREYGNARTIFFEGESNYTIKEGDQLQFAMFKNKGINFSAEWRINPQNKSIKEIEFFREQPVSRRAVIKAFENNEEIDKLKQYEAHWRFIFRAALATTLALLLMLLMSIGNDGTRVFSQEFDLRTIGDTETVISNPVEISEPGLFSLNFYMKSIDPNSDQFVFAYILDEEKAAINQVEGDFYFYTGVDDEGRWTEEDRDASKLFKLEEAGTYYIQLFKNKESTTGGTIEVSVSKGVWLSRYFLFGFILFILFSIYARSRYGR